MHYLKVRAKISPVRKAKPGQPGDAKLQGPKGQPVALERKRK